jgi:hypothetical protein
MIAPIVRRGGRTTLRTTLPPAGATPRELTLDNGISMIRRLGVGAALAAAALVGGCSSGQQGAMPQGGTMDSGATRSETGSRAEWRSLVDPGLTAWRGYKRQDTPTGWRVADGVLTKEGAAADLVTRDQFGDFELAFDWKLAPGGNAGVFYRGTEEYDHIYWSGPEYQLLDDERHPDGRNRLTSAGAAYGLYPPPTGVVKPAGEWNSSRIVVRGNHVEHWMNGQKLLEYELGSEDWRAKVAASKFHQYPNYGLASRGYIGLQGDHAGTLAIRDLRIREIR